MEEIEIVNISEEVLSGLYCADKIAYGDKIKEPLAYHGKLYVSVGSCYHGGLQYSEIIEVVDKKVYTGSVKTYADQARKSLEEGRAEAFYDGMLVTCAGKEFVLIGEARRVKPNPDLKPAEQTELF